MFVIGVDLQGEENRSLKTLKGKERESWIFFFFPGREEEIKIAFVQSPKSYFSEMFSN